MEASEAEQPVIAAAEEHYFHKSLYRFDGVARREVIRRFNTAVSDISSRCWYLDDKDTFELKCPNEVGYLRDETLGQIISAYIEEQLAAAAQDETPPHVIRFPDSNLEEFTFADADDIDPVKAQELWDAQPAPQPGAQIPNCTTFHVADPDQSKIKVKLFRLHELPSGQVQRVLARQSDVSVWSMCMSGVTLCAVKVAQSGQHIFNGRIGQPLPVLDAEEKRDFLVQVPFRPIYGTARPPELEPGVCHWRTKDGADVTVKQWLSGLGETEQYDPRKEPEIRDEPARLPIEQATPPQIGFGRRWERDDDSSDSSSDTPAAGPSANRPSFAALLRQEPIDDESSHSGNDDGPFPLAAKPRSQPKKEPFASLLANRYAIIASPSQSREQNPLYGFNTCSPNRSLERTKSPNIAGSVRRIQLTSTSGSSEQLEVAFHGKGFAAVDTVGLNASASSQASWEMLYAESRPKQARSGLRLAARHLPETSDNQTPTVSEYSHGASPLRASMTTASAVSSQTQATVRQVPCAHAEADEPSWVNRVLQPSAPDPKLLDDTAAESVFVSCPPTLELPPGVRPPPGLYPLAPRSGPVKPLDLHLGDDIRSPFPKDCGDSRQIMPSPGLTSRSSQPIDVSTISTQTVSGFNDGITERLQQHVEQTSGEKYTMRQQAGKKKQKAKGSTSKPAVQLPKPAPPPPPQKKMSKKQQSHDQKASTDESAVVINGSQVACHAEGNENGIITEKSDQTGEKTKPESILAPLLSTLQQPGHYRTRAHFGKVVVQYGDPKDLRRKVLLADEALKLPIKATTFLDRLTTLASDASYILDLATTAGQHSHNFAGDQELAAFYEWHLTDTSNHSWVVTIFDDHHFETQSTWAPVIQMFEHFPRHVWDARWQIEAFNSDVDEMSIRAMVNTISTGAQLPSLFAAVPVDLTPSRILAKREYRREHVPGVILVVTDVQDLRLESLSGAASNLKAWSASEDVMAQEGRHWWEARLDVDKAILLDDPGLVQDIVRHYVTQMDGVGFQNRGPWVWQEVVKNDGVEEVPFW